jgi:hypothetical protein
MKITAAVMTAFDFTFHLSPNMRIEYRFPCTAKHGPFKVVGTSSAMETAAENALWHYNNTIAHDGFPPGGLFPQRHNRQRGQRGHRCRIRVTTDMILQNKPCNGDRRMKY